MAVVAAVLMLSGCGGGSKAQGREVGAGEHTDDISSGVEVDAGAAALVPADVKEEGVLLVAMDLTSPPSEFLASDNKTPIGFNPDMARLIAKKLGLELKMENVKFDTIIPGLEGGRYDLTVSSMAVTEDRMKVLDMIDYVSNGSSIAVGDGNPDGLTPDTLCGRSIGVQSGSVQEIERLPLLSAETCDAKGKPAIKGVSLPSVQDALTQVASGRIDGVFYDTTSLSWADKQQPGTFEVLTPQVNSNDNAVALGKGSALTPAVQAALQSIIDSPIYADALERWGFDGLGIDEATMSVAEEE
ncbi:ABC transporter substrate-binding protein [Nocardioides eburneiflavus]|uniref:ABC transporter substrate-binding protein n=1 Tax=Nocardioides eburneiflavus TaxID=2518372 RepID=UPI001B2FEEC1|nr:ABC transporter substrate-binding protein [Nocardioides eburneiflavus]